MQLRTLTINMQLHTLQLDFHDRDRVSETDVFNVLDDAYHSIFAEENIRMRFRRDGQGKEEYTDEEWSQNRKSDEKLIEARVSQVRSATVAMSRHFVLRLIRSATVAMSRHFFVLFLLFFCCC
jgi:hypothetical protein